MIVVIPHMCMLFVVCTHRRPRNNSAHFAFFFLSYLKHIDTDTDTNLKNTLKKKKISYPKYTDPEL